MRNTASQSESSSVLPTVEDQSHLQAQSPQTIHRMQKQRTRRPICKDDRPSIVVGREEIEKGPGSQTSGWRHLVSDDYSLISYGRLY